MPHESFAQQLAGTLPFDVPERERLIVLGARHLALVVDENTRMNLTRIVEPREAAIKHVFDSVAVWRLLPSAGNVLDVGSGAGFPGIPLAIALPSVSFVLAESVQKKAVFLQRTVQELGLPNVRVMPERAEQVLQTQAFQCVVARAVGSMETLLRVLGPVAGRAKEFLFYKGPEPEEEIGMVRGELQKRRLSATIAQRYELPDALGTRTLVRCARSR